MAHINFIHSFEDFLSLPPNTQDMEFSSGEYDNHAWKLHICLNQNDRTVSDPVIKNTAKFLIDNNISFKMGNGGDGGKVYTIYVGEYHKAMSVATQLNERFSEEYKKDFPKGTGDLTEDMHVFDNIGMRFEGVADNWCDRNKDSLFSYYGYEGIPSIDKDQLFNGIYDCQLSALACHIFLAENCGSKYLGPDYKKKPWANEIFKNLPNKYTYQEISDYVSSALDLLKSTNQRRFIYDKNLVPSSQGIILSIDDIIPSFRQSNVLHDEISFNVKDLEIMPDANKITIYKNKFGNDILEYKRGNKLLASCSLNSDEHLVRLYADDGTFQEYITLQNGRTKQIRGNVLYPITKSLEYTVDNIASLSKSLGERYLKRAENINGTPSQANQSKMNQGR